MFDFEIFVVVNRPYSIPHNGSSRNLSLRHTTRDAFIFSRDVSLGHLCLHQRVCRTLRKRGLSGTWSLVIPWKGGWCGAEYFGFVTITSTWSPNKAPWYSIESSPPHPICSQSSIVLLLTLWETTDSPSVSPETHTNSPLPQKKKFSFSPPFPPGYKNDSFCTAGFSEFKPKTV